MLDFISKVTIEQWIKIALVIITLFFTSKFIFQKVKKYNKAGVKNVRNSKIDIRQENN